MGYTAKCHGGRAPRLLVLIGLGWMQQQSPYGVWGVAFVDSASLIAWMHLNQSSMHETHIIKPGETMKNATIVDMVHVYIGVSSRYVAMWWYSLFQVENVSSPTLLAVGFETPRKSRAGRKWSYARHALRYRKPQYAYILTLSKHNLHSFWWNVAVKVLIPSPIAPP